MKLSVIVPVYKVEKFIFKCLESLVNQDLSQEEYEIIVINDGSPDNSKDIILDFQQQYLNIIYIEQENQGVSIARNKGLAAAKGEFITFVDSDDFITPNSLKKILETAEKLDLDILYLSLDLVDEKGNFIEHTPKIGKDGIVKNGFAHERRTFPPTLYKRKCIGTIVFEPKIPVGEDTVFNALVQSQAMRCSYYSSPYYNYRIREQSASRMKKNDTILTGFLHAITAIINFKNNNYPLLNTPQEDYFNKVLLLFVERSIQWFVIPNSKRYYFETLKSHLNDNHLNHLVTEISLKYRYFDHSFIEFRFYNLIKNFYYKLLSLMSKCYRKCFKK